MKKLYFIIAALIACVGAKAQTIGDDIHIIDRLYFPYASSQVEIPVIPDKYSFDNKTYMAPIHADETTTTIDIINDEVETIKTITIPNLVSTEQPYSITRERADRVVLKSSVRIDSLVTDESHSYPGIQPDMEPRLISELFRQHGNGPCPEFDSCGVINGYIAFFNTRQGFFNNDKYGNKYPSFYCLYIPEPRSLVLVYNDYSISYTGEWIETKTLKNYPDLYPITAITFRNANTGFCLSTGTAVTQTLFNNDEAFEYLQPIYKLTETYKSEDDRDKDGIIDEIITDYNYIGTGYNIMSENGNILHTLSFEEYLDEADIQHGGIIYNTVILFEINNKLYFMVHISDRYALYIINPGTTEIQKVGTPIKMSISPRVVDRNESINVRLSEADNAAREIAVRNAAGQTVHKTTIPAGQTGIQISSSQLSNGLNVISVKDGKNRQENCKVMVR